MSNFTVKQITISDTIRIADALDHHMDPDSYVPAGNVKMVISDKEVVATQMFYVKGFDEPQLAEYVIEEEELLYMFSI